MLTVFTYQFHFTLSKVKIICLRDHLAPAKNAGCTFSCLLLRHFTTVKLIFMTLLTRSKISTRHDGRKVSQLNWGGEDEWKNWRQGWGSQTSTQLDRRSESVWPSDQNSEVEKQEQGVTPKSEVARDKVDKRVGAGSTEKQTEFWKLKVSSLKMLSRNPLCFIWL